MDKKKHEGFFDSIKALEKELGERDVLTKDDIQLLELRFEYKKLVASVVDAEKQYEFALRNLKETKDRLSQFDLRYKDKRI